MASTPPADRLLTIEEYAQLPHDPAYKDELSRGRVVREPRPGVPHGRVQLRLGARLVEFVTEHDLGYVVVEAGFMLERDPDTLRGPDVAFVSKEQYGDELPIGWPETAPDLAVEIVSPSNRISELLEKAAQYLGAGARIVWIIDPRRRMATAFHGQGEVSLLNEQDYLDGGDVVPGFQCLLRDILD